MSQFKGLEEVLGEYEVLSFKRGKTKLEFKIYKLEMMQIIDIGKRWDNLFTFDSKKELSELIGNNLEASYEIIGMSTKSPKEDIKKAVEKNMLKFEEFVSIAEKVIEVNSEVFLGVLAKVQGAKNRMATMTSGGPK